MRKRGYGGCSGRRGGGRDGDGSRGGGIKCTDSPRDGRAEEKRSDGAQRGCARSQLLQEESGRMRRSGMRRSGMRRSEIGWDGVG